MKSSIVLGYDEHLVYNIILEVGGDNNIASKRLYGSTTSGIYDIKYFVIKYYPAPIKNVPGPRIIGLSE